MRVADGAADVFETVTVTDVDVVRLPAASRASAVSVWDPSATVVVFHAIEYGGAVSSAPRSAPFSLNCTPATPTLSDALAVTVVVPPTVAPDAGAVIATVGGVESEGVEFSTVTVIVADVVRLPAASRASAVSVWDPSATVVVFHAIE